MSILTSNQSLLTWDAFYSEAALLKSAVRLYTKPLFNQRQLWQTSGSEENFLDFARHGLKNLEQLHRQLQKKKFTYGPALARDFNFNGKHRTLYSHPWHERLVDLLLYRQLCLLGHAKFHTRSYAYRLHGYGVDRCQKAIQRDLKQRCGPVFVIKRDIRDYFNSINHSILLEKLKQFIAPDDYLFELLKSRIRFPFYREGESVQLAIKGVPFGTAVACFLANFYLIELDHLLNSLPGVTCYRYADDFLLLCESHTAADLARSEFNNAISDLALSCKPSHSKDIVLNTENSDSLNFESVTHFRYLGLKYATGGAVSLSIEKSRKIRNLFKFALRREKRRYNRVSNPFKRAQIAVRICRRVLDKGIRGVAIIDYYLRHIDDTIVWKQMDLWLAEECLHWVFRRGHKKHYFKTIPFKQLRAMGLPSLLHRQRLIHHGHIESSFFIWQSTRAQSRRNTSALSK